MAISENMKRLREQRGMSQAELAASVELAQPQIAKYEAGVAVPNAVSAVAIAVVLGTTVEQLVNGGKEESA